MANGVIWVVEEVPQVATSYQPETRITLVVVTKEWEEYVAKYQRVKL